MNHEYLLGCPDRSNDIREPLLPPRPYTQNLQANLIREASWQAVLPFPFINEEVEVQRGSQPQPVPQIHVVKPGLR